MKIAPLKGSFMVMSIVGFFVSALLIYPASNSFGFAFGIVFVAMFISSLVSMTYAPIEEARLSDLDRGPVMHVGKPKKRTAVKRSPARKAPKRKAPVKKKSAKKTAKKKAVKKKSKKRK